LLKLGIWIGGSRKEYFVQTKLTLEPHEIQSVDAYSYSKEHLDELEGGDEHGKVSWDSESKGLQKRRTRVHKS